MTHIARSHQTGNSLTLKADNAVLGDSLPGNEKVLGVFYLKHGHPHVAATREHGQLSIHA